MLQTSAAPLAGRVHGHWLEFIGGLGVALLVSLFLANVIAFCLQMRQEHRIHRKTEMLAHSIKRGDAKNEEAPRRAVPVTILTGFLGAGKTTLLNRILHAPEVPFKIMVLENELGTISIDHAVLKPGVANADLAKEGIYVLQNGCMCCTRGSKSAGNELERILDYLLRLVNEDGFDYLLVETTGLADPGPIIETFLQLRASRFRMDAVVTLVDARAIQSFYQSKTQSFELPIELQRQLLYADVVALNKTDLVTPEEVRRAQEAVMTFNASATMLQCKNAEVDLTQIIGVKTFDAARFHAQGSASSRSVASHTSGVESMYLEVDGDLDMHQFSTWLEAVTVEYARAHILRIKGVLSIEGNVHRGILQCVLDTYTIAPATPWGEAEPRICRVVIIGKNLKRAELERTFRECFATTRGDGDSASSDHEHENDHEHGDQDCKKQV